MKKIITLLSIVLMSLVFIGTANAHVKLTSSMPTDGATLSQAPKMAMLHFSKAIRLVKLTLVRGEKPVSLAFKSSKRASKMAHIPLPKLSAGQYKMSWTLMGKDGHKMKDSISFNVK